jgi:hypothetical protein
VDVSIEDGDKNWNAAIDRSKGAPVTFTAKFLKGSGGTYTKTYSPASIQPNVRTALNFSLTSTSAEPLYLLVQTADDLKKIDTNENYFLANDIDLSTLNEGKWEGPTNYKGHFNGNNKTITLSLSKTDGDTGLFTSLADGAIIENLQVAVKTKGDAALAMEASSHFGGVVGLVDNGTYTIRSVRVRGSLAYAKGSNYLLAGALIGEIAQGKNATILIENCESDITITGTVTGEKTSTPNTMFSFGGLIGKSSLGSGSVTIKNSHTSGTIDVTNDFKASNMTNSNNYKGSSTFAGGLIGVEGQNTNNADATKCALIIENCYSTMGIVIKTNQSANDGKPTSAGGLIGSLSNNNSGSKIINSVALNPKVLAIASSNASSGRVIGKRVGFTAVNASLSNYARNDMVTGTSGNSEVNDNAGSVDSDDGAAQDSNFFNDAANWKAKSFTDANWDFTQVAANGYPALKFK